MTLHLGDMMDYSKKVLLVPAIPELHHRGRCGCWYACGVQSHNRHKPWARL